MAGFSPHRVLGFRSSVLSSQRKGMTLVEVLVAIALGALFIVAAVSLIAPALRVNTQTNTAQTIGSLSKELSDNIRAWAGGNWQNVFALSTSSANSYYLNTSSSPFTAVQGKEGITIGSSTYARYFYVDDAYRDTSGNVTSTSGGTNVYDPSTKRITVVSGLSGPPVLVQTNKNFVNSASVVGIAVSSTAAGNALIVAVHIDSNSKPVTSVTDSTGKSFAEAIAYPTSDGFDEEIWYSTSTSAGVTNVSTTIAANVNKTVWVYEVSGLNAAAMLDTTGTISAGSASSTAYGPTLTTASASEFLVAAEGFANNITGIAPGSAWTDDGPQNGDSAAHLITSQTGAYSAAWKGDVSGGYDGAGATFKGGSSVKSAGSQTTSFYVTRSTNNAYDQTDWSGGNGQNGPLTTTNSLFSAATNTVYTTPGSISVSPSAPSGCTVSTTSTTGGLRSWSTTTQLPVSLASLPAVVNNGYIYTVGGAQSSAITSTVNFAPVNSTGSIGNWTSTTALPIAFWAHSAVVYNGYIYALAGAYDTASDVTSTVFYALLNATGSISNWSSTTPLLSALSNSSAVINNGYIYTVGGGHSGAIATVYYAKPNGDGSISNWSSTTALPKGTLNGSTVVNNGYIYETGGEYFSAMTSTVNYAKPNGDGSISNWSSTTALPSVLENHFGVANNGYIYTLGGEDSVAATSTVYFAPINSDGSIGNWTTFQPLPETLYKEAATVYNGHIYAAGGWGKSGLNKTVYQTTFCSPDPLNTWKTTTQLPQKLQYHANVGYNGYLYTMGGWDSGSHATTTVNYAFLNATGSISNWSSTAALPGAIVSESGAAYNGYIYVTGGCDSTCTDTTTVTYALLNGDGSISNWSSTTALPSPIENLSTVAYNGYLYTTGGYHSGPLSTVYFAPINSTGSLGNWSSTKALPGTVDLHFAAVNNGYIYTAGGETWGTPTSSVFYAQLNATGSISNWSLATPLPSPLSQVQGMAINGAIYSVGGAPGTSTVFYAPILPGGVLGNWRTTSKLTGAMYTHAAAAYNGYIYTTGGNLGGSLTQTVEYTSIDTGVGPQAVATGTLDTTVYDTGVAGGAQLNSVLWQGTQPAGTTVQFQFATSNASSGPWSFIGDDGTGNVWYVTGPNTSLKLNYSLFNNYRYFKIRTYLSSNASGTQSPTVNDVVVNWSP
jgi:prepilin-type N-terminal cleavage/methylation domain-containing protein